MSAIWKNIKILKIRDLEYKVSRIDRIMFLHQAQIIFNKLKLDSSDTESKCFSFLIQLKNYKIISTLKMSVYVVLSARQATADRYISLSL